MGAATIGNKAYFAGGNTSAGFTTNVEVYDFTTGTWGSEGNLSVPREIIGGTVSCGTKIFVAGGYNEIISYNVVDIYDTELNEWSVGSLSIDRFSLAAVSYGDTVMFAGGVQRQGAPVFKSTVDFYNVETEVWSTGSLSQARMGMAASVVGDKAIFAGGMINVAGNTSNRVDIYNFTTKTWTQASLSLARAYASAVTVGNKVIIAGGVTSANNPTNRVDIYDAETNSWTTASLSSPRSAVDNGAVVEGKAYFAGGGIFTGSGFTNPSNVVDVYDPETNVWSVMNLQTARSHHSVQGVGNYLVVAGGKNNDGLLSSAEIYYDAPPGNIIHVPGDYATIQEGIIAAEDGDTVLVAENTYFENIDFIGKAIVVASKFIMDGDTNHIVNTIIDGSQPENPDLGSVVTFTSGEDTTSVLCGFTITGGTGTLVPEVGNSRFGGGVLFFSGGKLINNYIEYNNLSNEGYAIGGGIFAGGPFDPLPRVVLRNNRINNNKAISSTIQGMGGGIEIWFNLIMENNQLSWNEATGAFRGDGGGARISGNYGHIDITISDNVFTHNKAKSNSATTDLVISGGLDIFLDCSGTVSNNTVSFNEIEVAEGKWGYGSGVMVEAINDQEFIFENNLVMNNTFTVGNCMGGGLLVYDANGKYQNNVIQNNQATHGGGIGVSGNTLDYYPIFINNTVTGNEATYGGGLWAGKDAAVINTIIWDNVATNGASIFEVTALEVLYSDVEGDEVWPGEGNMNEEPEFDSDGYHLSQLSPLVDVGIESILVNGVCYNCPANDIDGDARPYANSNPEIGVDEVLPVGFYEPASAGNHAIRIFPNPAGRELTISVENGLIVKQVSLIHWMGQRVYTGSLEVGHIDVSELPRGIYVLSIETNKGEVKKKIVIQ
jgi:hypothetical protein